ncbi:Uncharacterized protein dnl_19730 [Desulfonema limicola]|uniref:Uncharacterized protein n=1 Tax=Desulfonema limicola TaxID=45656 RepID=A0A975B6R8_9BACT|nr:Uncharacterized protein dnl_19730 [Desulfonema limicola]
MLNFYLNCKKNAKTGLCPKLRFFYKQKQALIIYFIRAA